MLLREGKVEGMKLVGEYLELRGKTGLVYVRPWDIERIIGQIGGETIIRVEPDHNAEHVKEGAEEIAQFIAANKPKRNSMWDLDTGDTQSEKKPAA